MSAVCVHVCTHACLCVSAEQQEGSVVVTGNTPTPALNQPAPATKPPWVCSPGARVHPSHCDLSRNLCRSLCWSFCCHHTSASNADQSSAAAVSQAQAEIYNTAPATSHLSHTSAFSVLWGKFEHGLLCLAMVYFT